MNAFFTPQIFSACPTGWLNELNAKTCWEKNNIINDLYGQLRKRPNADAAEVRFNMILRCANKKFFLPLASFLIMAEKSLVELHICEELSTITMPC